MGGWERGLAITMMAACTQQWEGNGGLGLQPRVAGSSHKVRIGGWAKLQTRRRFGPTLWFHLHTETRLAETSDYDRPSGPSLESF